MSDELPAGIERESGPRRKTIEEMLRDGTQIDQLLREAGRPALLRHKLLGESIIVWEDGKIVEIPAEQIQV